MIAVQDQPWKIVHETPISKIVEEKWAGGMAQWLSTSFANVNH
jgi:hypothetical protein